MECGYLFEVINWLVVMVCLIVVGLYGCGVVVCFLFGLISYEVFVVFVVLIVVVC